MTDQQFCLRWNNHQSTLVAVFDGLLEKGVLVDCTLAAEGQQLTAHKVVLAACSPFLETLLSRHYDKHPILILKDVKFSELKAMMDYMYRGEVNISQDQLGTFLKAAESLQIKGLSDGGGSDKPTDTYTNPPQKRHHTQQQQQQYHHPHQERKPLRPTSPLRNSMADAGKRPPPPPYLHQNSIRNSLKSSPLLVDIPEDSSAVKNRDGSISPIPRKKKRPPRETQQQVEDPLNNNSILGSGKEDHQQQNHIDSRTGDVQTGAVPPTAAVAQRVPSPSAVAAVAAKSEPDPDPSDLDDKTDPVAHLKHELIEEEEDINEDSMELTMDEDDCGEAGPSHNDGEFPGDVFGGSQEGDGRDGQVADFSALQLLKEKWEVWQSQAQNLHSLTKVLQNQKQQMTNSNGNSLAMPTSPTSFGSESPKNVECGRCGRRYKLKSSLRNHQKWECGKEPRFQCPYCVYRAKQKMHVERHIERMHKAQLRAFYDNGSANGNGNGEQAFLDVNNTPPEITLFDKMKDITGKLLVDATEAIRQT